MSSHGEEVEVGLTDADRERATRMAKSFRDGQTTKPALSDPNERKAAKLLEAAGWSIGELAMTFQCSERAMRGVVNATGAEVKQQRRERQDDRVVEDLEIDLRDGLSDAQPDPGGPIR